MSGSYWEQVRVSGLAVPADRPLPDLTAELTLMLGDPDPDLRDALARSTLTTWIGRGVYDDLLVGLGDGMAAGLRAGLGEQETDSVFRRSSSALVLGACVDRDSRQRLVPGGKVLEWGDRIATWLVRERDLRGLVPGKGWARAVAHGADAVGALARSPHLQANELTVLLDVLADRVLSVPGEPFSQGEADRLAKATMQVLSRDLVSLSVLEPWIARVAAGAGSRWTHDEVAGDPIEPGGNAEDLLRALYLQLGLAPAPPTVRADLLLVLVDALRRSNPDTLGPPVSAGAGAGGG